MRTIPEKLSLVVFCWVGALVLPVPGQLSLLFLLACLPALFPSMRPASDTARRSIMRFLIYAFSLAGAVIVLNGVFTHSGTTIASVGPVRLDAEGVAFGVRVSSRLLLMTASILLFFASTPLRIFARFLEESGVPTVLTSVLLLSLDFLERIPARIDQIYTSQESRGAPVREGVWARARSLVAVLGPLVLSALVESIERSHALELRGFQLRRPSRPSAADTSRPVSAVVLLVLSVLLLAWGLWQMLSR